MESDLLGFRHTSLHFYVRPKTSVLGRGGTEKIGTVQALLFPLKGKKGLAEALGAQSTQTPWVLSRRMAYYVGRRVVCHPPDLFESLVSSLLLLSTRIEEAVH